MITIDDKIAMTKKLEDLLNNSLQTSWTNSENLSRDDLLKNISIDANIQDIATYVRRTYVSEELKNNNDSNYYLVDCFISSFLLNRYKKSYYESIALVGGVTNSMADVKLNEEYYIEIASGIKAIKQILSKSVIVNKNLRPRWFYSVLFWVGLYQVIAVKTVKSCATCLDKNASISYSITKVNLSFIFELLQSIIIGAAAVSCYNQYFEKLSSYECLGAISVCSAICMLNRYLNRN